MKHWSALARFFCLGCFLGPCFGTSTDDAFVVISQVEEYAVMDSLGLRPTGQGLFVQDDVPYDRFDTVDDAGSTKQLYFDVSALMPRGQ